MSVQKLHKTFKKLFPSGLAWRFVPESTASKVFLAKSRVYFDAFLFMTAILDKILPDNDNFTAQDAANWERRLAVISSPTASLESRKAAIIRKMRYPGEVVPRQHYLHIQQQLQLAGFDVFVYENIPTTIDTYAIGTESDNYIGTEGDEVIGYSQGSDFEPVEPGDLAGNDAIYGAFQYGGANYGEVSGRLEKVVNSLDPAVDAAFNEISIFTIFYICGPTFGEYVNINPARREEFRQLLLMLKPVQNVGYLLFNYVYEYPQNATTVFEPTGKNLIDMCIFGSLIYLIESAGGTNTGNPKIIRIYNTSGSLVKNYNNDGITVLGSQDWRYLKIDATERYLFACGAVDNAGFIQVIDRDTGNILSTESRTSAPTAVFVVGNILYYHNGSSLSRYEFLGGTSNTTTLVPSFGGYSVSGFCIVGSYAYVTTFPDKVVAFNLNTGQETPAESFTADFNALQDIDFVEDRFYVTDGTNEVRVFDVQDKSEKVTESFGSLQFYTGIDIGGGNKIVNIRAFTKIEVREPVNN